MTEKERKTDFDKSDCDLNYARLKNNKSVTAVATEETTEVFNRLPQQNRNNTTCFVKCFKCFLPTLLVL